jgi:hypothetical protein
MASTGDYLDCELFLSNHDQAKLSVVGRDYTGRPALGEELERQLLEVAQDTEKYGSILFEALFRGDDDLRAGYREGLAIARHQEKRLRFRLHIAANAPPKLHLLDWEFLYDPKARFALACSPETVFSRYESVPYEPGTLVKVQPKLLIVISSPKDLSEFKLADIDRAETKRSIEEALRPLNGEVTYEFLEAPATSGKIRDRLVNGGFHALHIQAHGLLHSGQTNATLLLEKEDGKANPVDEDRFSKIFEGERNLRLITLIACHGGVQTGNDPFGGLGPSLVRRGIPAVVAMRQAISINTAKYFIQHFYRNLARTGQVDTAANEARQQLYLSAPESREWGAPAVFMRLNDGKLWEPDVLKAGVGLRRQPMSESSLPWSALIQRLDPNEKQKLVIPFLGPGMIRGLLPSGEDIAAQWANKYKYPFDFQSDLPRVGQFVATTKKDPKYPQRELHKILKKNLLERVQVKDREHFEALTLNEVIEKIAEQYFDQDPKEPHRILANMPFSTYITTNLDSFMTEALKWVKKIPQRKICKWNRDYSEGISEDEDYKNLEGTVNKPLIIHLFGDVEHPNKFVLTEDDHLDFLTRFSMDPFYIPSQVEAALNESMLLFLGYNMGHLGCRVLYRGIVAQLRPRDVSRIAVIQISPDESHTGRVEALQDFMEKYCKPFNIEIYWGSIRDFLTELYDRWEREYGKPEKP